MGRAAAAVSAPSRQRSRKSSPTRRSSGSANGRTGAHTRQSAAAGARHASAARAVAAPQAVPRRAPRTRTAPPKRRTGTAPLVQRIARGRIGAALDWILRGRACVFLFGALLAGVVFFNVSLLEKNEGIARTNAKATTIAHENQLLRRKLAKLDSSERIQTEAVKRGFSLPAAGDVGYVDGDVNANARTAAERIVAPGTGTGVASRPIGTDHDVSQSSPTTTGATEAPEPTTVQPQTQTAAPQATAPQPTTPTPQPTTPTPQPTTPASGTTAAPGTATGP